MRILVVGPLPQENYRTGQAAAVDLLYRALQETDEVRLVDIASVGRGDGLRLRRVFEAIGTAWRVAFEGRWADIIYFTISESKLGNLRDFLVYVVCVGRLQRIVVHLHGGQGMRKILQNQDGVLFSLNRVFLSRIKRVIVLGDSQRDIFAQCVKDERIAVVPNFADTELFLEASQIFRKHERRHPLRVLFLSNLISGKGHSELLHAFLALADSCRQRLQIDFAGVLPDNEDGRRFRLEIRGLSNVRYHGPVFGEQKKLMLRDANVFCLPTYYAYEGQPISILEAYASGCAVISTYHSGIVDIFEDGVNGFVVEPRSVDSLRRALEKVCHCDADLLQIGLRNNGVARERYTTQRHLEALMRAIKS